jgi:hypothetical protein
MMEPWQHAAVFAEARKVIPVGHVWTWVYSTNRLLDGKTPAQVVEAGGISRVLDLLAAMADGIPV